MGAYSNSFYCPKAKKKIFGLTKLKPNPNQTPKSSVFSLNFGQKELCQDHVDHFLTMGIRILFWQFTWPHLGDIEKNGYLVK